MGRSESAAVADPFVLDLSLKRFPILSPRSVSARSAGGSRRTNPTQVEIDYLETRRKRLQRGLVWRYREKESVHSPSDRASTPSEKCSHLKIACTKPQKRDATCLQSPRTKARLRTRPNLMQELEAMKTEPLPSPARHRLTVSDLDLAENMIMLEKITQSIHQLQTDDRTTTANAERSAVFSSYGKRCLERVCKLVRKADNKTRFYRWPRTAIVSALENYAQVLNEPVDLIPEQDQPPTPPSSAPAIANIQVDDEGALAVAEPESQPAAARPKTSPIVIGPLTEIRHRVQVRDRQQKRLRAVKKIQTSYRCWIWRRRWPEFRCRLQIQLWYEMSLTLIPFQAALWHRTVLRSCKDIRDDDELYEVDRGIRFEMSRRLHAFMGCYFADQPEPAQIAIIDKAMSLADRNCDDLNIDQTRGRRFDRWCPDPVIIARRKRRLLVTCENLNQVGAPRPKRLWHRLIWAYWKLRRGLNIALRHAFVRQSVTGKTVGEELWADPWQIEYAQV